MSVRADLLMVLLFLLQMQLIHSFQVTLKISDLKYHFKVKAKSEAMGLRLK